MFATTARLAALRIGSATSTNLAAKANFNTSRSLLLAGQTLIAQRSLATATPSPAAATKTKTARSSEAAPQRKSRAQSAEEKKLKERETAVKAKEKAQAKAAKEKERAQAKAAKEKEKAAKEKEKARAQAAKEKEKARAQVAKAKAKAPKLKPWELLDSEGNKIPLPIANKPLRRTARVIYFSKAWEQAKAGDMPAEFVNEAGKVKSAAFLTHLSQQWNNMSDAARQEYVDAAARENATYEKRYGDWKDALTPQDIQRLQAYDKAQLRNRRTGTRSKRAFGIKDPEKPKAVTSAFLAFANHTRANEQFDVKATEVAKLLGERWRNMSEQDKKPFQEDAARDAERYRREMQVYQQQQQQQQTASA